MPYTISFDSPCHVHFIGIGGISMSGLAEVLLDRGFTISGSDGQESDLTRKLESAGAKIGYPQDAANITPDIDLVVYSAAIHPDNPEYAAAKDAGIPMLVRSQLLGQMMSHYANSIGISGTHGKTTTTSMLAQILLEASLDPTISVGGIFKAIQSNIRVGGSDVFLTEACEYTNSFWDFYPRYTAILNIEEDHMDFFSDLKEIRDSFRHFAGNTLEGGTVIINAQIPDHEEICGGIENRNVITFSSDPSAAAADYEASDIRHDDQSHAFFHLIEKGEDLGEIRLSVAGEHNVANALCAIAIARQLGISFDEIASALHKFGGAVRRFEFKGEKNGAVIIDDYAHHPTEVAACISAARALSPDRLIVAFQPHTYTRTKAFLHEFADVLSRADLCILTDIYAAREQDIYGVSSKDVSDLIRKNGTESLYLPTFDEAAEYLEKNLTNGDMLITCGAGNIVNLGERLLD